MRPPLKKILHPFLLAGLLLVATGITTAAPERYQKAIGAFVKQDAEQPPAPGGVLFLGSSSIRMWKTLAEDFPGVPVINRGFGGSWIYESTHFFDQLVLPAKPRLIVFFAGTNDIRGGKTAEQVAADFREFCTELHTALPKTCVIFISIALAPSRWDYRAAMSLANTYIAAFCKSDERLTFVDMNSVMLTPDGKPREEYYLKDRLHMNADGYAVWAKTLRPLVK
jgi:lysophospholipase L1-like esterase